MKKRILLSLLLVCLLSPLLAGCRVQKELNIIDDSYRNWYEIFVYSYYDTNNDGIGDLAGVTEKLDYIKDLGFNGIWLMPIHPSPTYHKYDVTDYYAIAPEYGTMDDLKTLIGEAHARGIRVILDLVVNHTSDSHPWFREACAYIREHGEVGGTYGEYYNFTKQKLGGYSPVSGTDYYYESRFWSGMPDLNLDSPAVREELSRIMEYYLLTLEADGFRLDAVTSYYTGQVDKNIEFIRWLNDTAKAMKPSAYIVGEAWETSDYQIGRYYESGADSFFLFTGAQATGTIATLVKQQNGRALGEWMAELEENYGADTVLAPFLGNHDTMRPGSFMPGEENVKMAGGVLAMMSGSIFVYYGEEIGMISRGGSSSDPAKRIAMKWSDRSVYPGWCYISPEGTPVDEASYYYPSVETQENDPDSILSYYRAAMELRGRFPSIARGTVTSYPIEDNAYLCVLEKTWEEETITIVINLDAFPQTLTLPDALAEGRSLVGELSVESSERVRVSGKKITLPPYTIAIFK